MLWVNFWKVAASATSSSKRLPWRETAVRFLVVLVTLVKEYRSWAHFDDCITRIESFICTKLATNGNQWATAGMAKRIKQQNFGTWRQIKQVC